VESPTPVTKGRRGGRGAGARGGSGGARGGSGGARHRAVSGGCRARH
jgi:hypothetical protein